jgi:PII-like signaling protein
MSPFQPATLLRLHVCERDRYKGRALHTCILEKCVELRMTRVTAVCGFEGYGGSSEIHRSHPLYHNLPIVITVIDVPGKISQLVATVEEMMETGVIATSPVEMLAVNRRAQVHAAS